MGGRAGPSKPCFKVFSDMLNQPIPARGLRALIDLLARPSRGYTAKLQMDSFGGQINKLGASQTAFSHRQSLACFQALVYWNTSVGSAEPLAALAQLREAYAPFASGQCYQNYVDQETWPNRWKPIMDRIWPVCGPSRPITVPRICCERRRL